MSVLWFFFWSHRKHCIRSVVLVGPKLFSVIFVNMAWWDENPSISRSLFSLVFIVQVYSSFNFWWPWFFFFSFEAEKYILGDPGADSGSKGTSVSEGERSQGWKFLPLIFCMCHFEKRMWSYLRTADPSLRVIQPLRWGLGTRLSSAHVINKERDIFLYGYKQGSNGIIGLVIHMTWEPPHIKLVEYPPPPTGRIMRKVTTERSKADLRLILQLGMSLFFEWPIFWKARSVLLGFHCTMFNNFVFD